MTRFFLAVAAGCTAILLAASDGYAQLLPPLGGIPGQVVGGVLGSPENTPVVAPVIDRLNTVVAFVPDTSSLLDLRRARLRKLVRENRRTLDFDDDGNLVRKDVVIIIDPAPDTLGRAQDAGFRILRDESIEEFQLRVVTLATPKGDDSNEGVKRLRRLAPTGIIDYDHVFEPAGSALLAMSGTSAVTHATSGQHSVGMIDGGVAAHPAFASASIEQRGFVGKGPRASGHGTAVASLIVGSQGRFSGAAPSVPLLVADVYGGDPSEGSAVAIAQGLGWLVSRGVRVVNVSLVGPSNPLLSRAITAAQARGVLIVAAVGNDGPAAPAAYPASYSGVIAVTGVDIRNRALPEAGKALHLDFAAPGADMAAALQGGGYVTVRGTSFAAPLVTSRLIAAGGGPAAVNNVTREIVKGRGKVGKGILCHNCRIAPRDVDAKK